MTEKKKALLHRIILKLLAKDFEGLHDGETNEWEFLVDKTIGNLERWERRCLAIRILKGCQLKPEHQEAVLERVYETIEDEVKSQGGDYETLLACCEYVREEDPQLHREKLLVMYKVLQEKDFDTGTLLDILEDIGIPDPDTEEITTDADDAVITGASNEG